LSNRLRHLNAAIDNLHAAGLHEMAERLTQEAEKMRQPFHQAPSQPPGPRGSRPPEGELAPLRQEIQELRRAVEEMRRQIEELRPRQP
jgi:prefoldin subunit 5